MPFTLAHAAAALPFHRQRIVISALIVGTFAPDFEYFLWMAPRSGFGHSFAGVFALTLPLGLAVLWLFHALVKLPAIGLLPDGLRGRLDGHLKPFCWLGAWRILAIVGSMLLGIATHLVWDWFTHRGSWLYWRWGFLRDEVRLPELGSEPHYKLLQHGSTVVGLAVLGIWFVGWYRGSADCSEARSVSPLRRRIVLSLLMAAALGGAAVRVVAFGRTSLREAVGEGVCAFIALVWWGMVGYGAVAILRGRVGPTDSRPNRQKAIQE